MTRRVGQLVFGLVVGLAVALLAYQWITDTERRALRAEQENVVRVARDWLVEMVASGDLDIVDPLSPNRKVGKVYVYAEPPGWAVSGYYRRNESDRWYPYLVTLRQDLDLERLKVGDPRLSGLDDPRVIVSDRAPPRD